MDPGWGGLMEPPVCAGGVFWRWAQRGLGLTLSTNAQSKCGILAMLDEECLRPGVVNEDTFVTKLNQLFATHKHYESKETQNAKHVTDLSLPQRCFRIHHYAGKVRSIHGHPQPRPWVQLGHPSLLPSFAWELPAGLGWGRGCGAFLCCPLSPS